MKRAAVRIVGGALVLFIALGGLLAWRLARGPIDLPLLTAYVTRALGSAGGPTVRVGATALMWDREDHGLRLGVRDVEVSSPSGERIGVVPSLTLGLSFRALLRGAIAPARVAAYGVRLRLMLRPDGTVDLGLGGTGRGTLDSSPRAVSDRLFGASRARASGAWLRSVVLRHGQVDLVDATDGSSWQARDVDLVLRAAGTGLRAELTGGLAFGPTHVPIRMDVTYERDPERVDVGLAFRGLDPSAVGATMPPGSPGVLRVLSGLRLSLDGRVAFTLDAALRPHRARLKLVGGQGTVRADAVPGQTLAVTRLRAALAADRDEDRIDLRSVSLDVGRSTVRVRGALRGLDGPGSADLAVVLADVPVDELGRYWPETVAVEVRRWVTENVRGGHVHRAWVKVAGTVADAVPTSLRLATLGGAFVFDGVAVRYLPAMSPVTGVAGVGTFSGRGLDVRVARGRIGGLEIAHATVGVAEHDGGRPALTVDGAVRGPVADAVALLEQQPSLAPSRMMMDVTPSDVGGTVMSRIKLAGPLGGAPDLRAMHPAVSATLRDLSVARLPRGWTLTQGDFTLALGRSTLGAKGSGRLQGVPVTLAGEVDLDGGRRTVELRSDVDAAGLAALGFTGLPRVHGDTAVQVRYVATSPPAATLAVTLDLEGLAIHSRAPALRKRAGAPGNARIDLVLAGAAVSAVEHLEVDLGATRVTGTTVLSDDGTRWQTAEAEAVLVTDARPPGRLALKLVPEGKRSRLTITSPDAGALESALGANFDMVGGRLVFVGSMDSIATGWPIDGHLDVGRFTLTRAPILARAALLVSLSGVTGALSGSEGLQFDRLSADLGERAGVLTIKSARATGPSLGVSVRGTLDFPKERLALEGSLVPAYYGLNRAAGRIPIVGQVLAGRRREGIQVFDFDVKGPFGGPEVTARPSSAAPGVVRDLLRLLEDRPGR